MIDFLLEKNANPNAKVIGGNTPLHLAFKNQLIDVIYKLVNLGGNLNLLNND